MKTFPSLLAAALIAAVTVTTPAFAKDANVLRLGIDPTYPPMDVKMPDGHVTGFDVDLADEICRRIAMHCEWVEMEFSGMIPALQSRPEEVCQVFVRHLHLTTTIIPRPPVDNDAAHSTRLWT